MITLYEDIGFWKIVFISFNPNNYTVGTNIFCSLFGYTPSGLIKIDDVELVMRIDNRLEPAEQIPVEYLFYGDI